MLGSEQFGEWAVDLIAHYFLVDDEDVLEDRLVELAPHLVTRTHVERVRIFKQSQVGLEEFGPVAQVIDHRRKLLTEFLALLPDVREASPNFALRERAIGREVQQVLFFGFEADQLIFELFAEQPLSQFSVGQCGFHSCSHRGDERGGKADRLVMLLDGLLDVVHSRIWGVADVVLDASAEEI